MKAILLTILVMTLAGCVTASREPISVQNKIDFKWDTLTLEEQIKVFAVASPVKVLGTGSINLTPDGGFEVDTSTKARVIGEVINQGLQTAAGLAKEAGGIF